MNVCIKCMTWHDGDCRHNADAPCPTCKDRLGYRWRSDSGIVETDQCWFCWAGTPRPEPRPPYVRESDWFDDLAEGR